MAITKVFYGPTDFFERTDVCVPFIPVWDEERFTQVLGNIANTFADLRTRAEYRPCVGGIVVRSRNKVPQVLMGVTASAALRINAIANRGEHMCVSERSLLAGHYTFPKGGCEERDGFDGDSVIATGLREVDEEMNLAPRTLRLLGVLGAVTGIEARVHEKEDLKRKSGFTEGKAHAHVVFALRRDLRIKPDPREMVSSRWVPPRRFLGYIAQNRPETQRVLATVYRSTLLALMMGETEKKCGSKS